MQTSPFSSTKKVRFYLSDLLNLTIWMEYIGYELHFGRTDGIICRKIKLCFEKSSFTKKSSNYFEICASYYNVSGGPITNTSHL